MASAIGCLGLGSERIETMLSDFILDEIFGYFASDPSGPLLSLPIMVDESQHPLAGPIERQLTLFTSDQVEEIKRDESFQFSWGHVGKSNLDRKARMW